MKKPFILLLFLCATAATAPGCATLVSLTEENQKNKVFSGTRMHLADLECAHAACVDLPFSLVADLVLLPYTIPKTLMTSPPGEKTPEAQKKAAGKEPKTAMKGTK
ncbi:MAG TPA: YceK/YidQ family lipoprotein [Syntrophorhabdaceae bacterium]